MKLISVLTIATLGFFLSPTFALENQSNNAAPSTQAAATQNQDNQVVAWLMALNQNEIAAAKVVLSRQVSPSVKAFAHQMVTDHSKNLKSIKELSKKDHITPSANDATKELKEKGKDELVSLKALQGRDFEVTYINAMVQGHANALKGLQEKIQMVSNPDLKKFLEQTSSTVTEHLEKAKSVKNSLQ